MRVSILPPSRPLAARSRGRVGGEPVVELEDRALEAAAVHRADDHLVLEGAEQQQVVEDVGGAEHAVDARAARRRWRAGRAARCGSPSPSCRRRTPSAPRAGWSAATSSRRPSSPTTGRRARVAQAWAMRCGSRARISVRSATDTVGLVVIVTPRRRHVRPRSALGWPGAPGPRPRSAWRWSTPGVDGDDGPGDVGELEDASQVPAGEQTVAQGAAERVAGAEAVDDVDRVAAGPRRARPRVAASTPLGPCLTTASSTPRSSSASAARCGSVSPTATSHSSRLPTATVTCSSALPTCAAGLVGVGPEHRPVVEVEDGVRCRRPRPARRRSGRCGSAPRTGR